MTGGTRSKECDEGRGCARADLARRALEPLRIPAGEDHLGALAAGALDADFPALLTDWG